MVKKALTKFRPNLFSLIRQTKKNCVLILFAKKLLKEQTGQMHIAKRITRCCADRRRHPPKSPFPLQPISHHHSVHCNLNCFNYDNIHFRVIFKPSSKIFQKILSVHVPQPTEYVVYYYARA